MRVTLYKDSAGGLHETYEAYAKAEGMIKIEPMLRELAQDDDDLVDFVMDNADALREILNSAVMPRRGRKPGSGAVSNDATGMTVA